MSRSKLCICTSYPFCFCCWCCVFFLLLLLLCKLHMQLLTLCSHGCCLFTLMVYTNRHHNPSQVINTTKTSSEIVFYLSCNAFITQVCGVSGQWNCIWELLYLPTYHTSTHTYCFIDNVKLYTQLHNPPTLNLWPVTTQHCWPIMHAIHFMHPSMQLPHLTPSLWAYLHQLTMAG